MNARFDPFQLERELLAAGFVHVNAGGSYIGCRSDKRRDQDGSDDTAQIVDWTLGHPTPAERAVAAAVLAAHDPTKRQTDETAARQRLLDLALKCENATATTAEVCEAVGRSIRRLV